MKTFVEPAPPLLDRATIDIFKVLILRVRAASKAVLDDGGSREYAVELARSARSLALYVEDLLPQEGQEKVGVG